jgi:aspartate beta-hydroxylase
MPEIMPSDHPFSFESTDRELDIAHAHMRNGRLADAENAYRRVLVEHPGQTEALRFIANAALSRGDPAEAVALLSRAVQADRSDAGVLLELGVAYRTARRMDEARSVFELALELNRGRNTTARLMLANVLELDQRPDMALLNYFRAIIDAQAAGQWLDDATTEPGLRTLVRHAMRYVASGRRELFESVLEPFRSGINAARLGRVDAALAIYLREQPLPTEVPLQRPTFLYFPNLGTDRFLDNARFDWLVEWSRRAACLDAEAATCLDSGKTSGAAAPIFSLESMTVGSPLNSASVGASWAVLYQHGMQQDGMQRHAPGLSTLLDSAPLVRIPDYAPDAAILALPPGTRTPPRYGRTNAFCTVVIAFAGSPPLHVTVGGETVQLQAGETRIFDPSFEFAYASASDAQTRALVFDVWNPNVASLERDAVAALAATAITFDRRLLDLA